MGTLNWLNVSFKHSKHMQSSLEFYSVSLKYKDNFGVNNGVNKVMLAYTVGVQVMKTVSIMHLQSEPGAWLQHQWVPSSARVPRFSGDVTC